MSGDQIDVDTLLAQMRAVNAASPFNAWAGFELVSAANGKAELVVTSRPELLQHAGFLHAGVVGALIDTACGFAAASISGNVVTSQYQVRCYRPAVGAKFIARANVVRSGKRQIFASAELFAINGDDETLVAGGDAILMAVT
jgi:uncharacterized protein (TIGR00369 family)